LDMLDLELPVYNLLLLGWFTCLAGVMIAKLKFTDWLSFHEAGGNSSKQLLSRGHQTYKLTFDDWSSSYGLYPIAVLGVLKDWRFSLCELY
jgi:hypothetical protein